MGCDDANEGHQVGECVEHEWAASGVTFAGDGAHVDYVCGRCGSLMVQTPAELRGLV